MKCPACSTTLSACSCGGQVIDVCAQCKGVWFDPNELGPVVTAMANRAETPALHAKEAFKPDVPRTTPAEDETPCPRCSVPTEIFNYSYDSNIFLNRCPTCKGIWADGGELQQLARYTKGNPQVQALAKDLAKFTRHEKSRFHKLLTSRPLSGGVAAVYLLWAAVLAGTEAALSVLRLIIFPLVCIWFSDAIGNFTGLWHPFRPVITKKSPGIIVAFMGWVLLLLPVVIGLIGAVSMK